MLRLLTAGESHGPCLTTILDGLPAGIPVDLVLLRAELARRRRGYGRGGRMAIEDDVAELVGGVRGGFTTGAPVAITIPNRDFHVWQEVMAVGPEVDLESRRHTRPRPGHADLAGSIKYGTTDSRNILERASARETAARVAAGYVCKCLLAAAGIHPLGHVLTIGGESLTPAQHHTLAEPVRWDLARWQEIRSKVELSPVRCSFEEAERRMMKTIDDAASSGDTVGGRWEVRVMGVPPGLGNHSQWDRRLTSRLAAAVMSIQAHKAVEVGDGWGSGDLRGSQVHDEIVSVDGILSHLTNRAGGVEGGMTNGEDLIVRGVMKPLSTLRRPLRSVDLSTGEEDLAGVERSDVCAVPAAVVVGEAMISLVLADALLEKTGGDHLAEVLRALKRTP